MHASRHTSRRVYTIFGTLASKPILKLDITLLFLTTSLHMNDTIQSSYNLINFLENNLNLNNYLSYSFWLSVVLAFLISFFKYFFLKKIQASDVGNFLLEFPIDICTIATTVVITGFIKEENLPHGIMVVVITLIVCALCCCFRRLSIEFSYIERLDYKMFVFGFLNILLASLWIAWVCVSIL